MLTCYLSEKRQGILSTLSAMWVAPEARQKGAGTALVEKAVSWSGASGATTVLAWVTEQNPRAVTFYEKVGFSRRDPLSLFTPDEAQADILFSRELSMSSGEEVS